MSKVQLNPNGKRKWPLSLYGCFDYVDLHGKKRWWPTFCCTAMICSNMMAGRVCTQIVEEKPCACGLGPQGACICLGTLPLGVYHPAAGFGVFCVLANCLREKAVVKYNIEEENYCCCGSWDYCCNFVHFGCNYPCSFFQTYMAIERWEEEMKNSTYSGPTVIAQPVVTTNPAYVQR